MRQGIQALENRYATLQKRADQGGFSPARMDKIANRMGRLENMGATGMRGGQPQGLMSGVRPSQPPQMPQQSAPTSPLYSQMQDKMARFPAGGQLPPGMAQSLGQAFMGGAPGIATMQGQNSPSHNWDPKQAMPPGSSPFGQSIDPGRTMQPQGNPYQNRMSVLDGGKFLQPGPQAPDFRKMAGAFGQQPQIDPATGQPRRY